MRFESVEWFPDGKRILFTGNQSGGPVRTWMYDLDADQAAPFTPEGVRASRVSPDGREIVISDPRQVLLRVVSGGEPRRISALEPGEAVLRWSGDGRYLYLQRPAEDAIRVSRLEVSSGRRELWRVLKVPEPGAEFFGPLAMSADGKAFAHSFQRDLANLYLVRGLR
jgi:Tol biopolymer transport system component